MHDSEGRSHLNCAVRGRKAGREKERWRRERRRGGGRKRGEKENLEAEKQKGRGILGGSVSRVCIS